MKVFKFLLIVGVFQFGFAQQSNFGAPISNVKPISISSLTSLYDKLAPEDSKTVVAKVVVNEVCQVKGCWLTFKLDDGELVRVKFKDYSFFVPKDSTGDTFIIEGIAGVEEQSVETLRHYAEDAGKSKEDIMKINSPKRTKIFTASGVAVLN